MRWSIGSTWLRWDPHIHAPGTLKENNYGPPDDDAVWDRYFATIRAAQPLCAAIGVTDYFVPRGYRLFVERGGCEKLTGTFVFPNVELRLKTRAEKGNAPNVHLLISPEPDDHLSVITSKLAGLTFTYDGEEYRCTEEDLRRLGRAFQRDPSLNDEAALRAGAAQFLVDYDHFAKLKRDPWIHQHVLFAVAAGNDGLGGLKGDGAFKAHREELGRIADVIFSGSPSERRYWLGDHPDVEHRISGVKPCLHGSDAHGFDRILAPDENRRTWVRGSADFDGLRQTLIEPRRRVHIGALPDDTRSRSNVIRTVRLRNAPWFTPTELALNDGLVTVIGARGSGKTALADLIALAADARDQEATSASFLQRAGDLLTNIEVELEWADGTVTPARGLSSSADEHPRVRYLSQQFVERLSQRERHVVDRRDDFWSDDDVRAPADPLLEEIERVVFEAIPVEDRMQAEGFASLRDARLGDYMESRRAARETIRRMTETISVENSKKRSIASLKTASDEATRARTAIEQELTSLPATASKEHLKAYEGAIAVHKALQYAIQQQASRAQRLQSLRSALQQEQARADEEHQKLRARYPSLLDEATWESLRLQIEPTAMVSLETLGNAARDEQGKLREHGMTQQSQAGVPAAGLAVLAERVAAAQKTLGEDETKSKRRADLVKKLEAARLGEEKAKRSLADAEGAASRAAAASVGRAEAYERLLQTLDAEVATLNELYESLKRKLAAHDRLRLLSFEVSRHVDLSAWASAGERIFDLRRAPFRGRGGVLDAARRLLEPAWRGGSPANVRAAIDKFYGDHLKDAEPRQGASMLDLGQWLYSTEHISIRYGIQYEGRDITNLSPGARGVVLLTLFLAIDDSDDRPLVIDQPEENLDPKSINGLLVPFFVEAARRRQIIMVTHNANLVVNTDADQVIVAASERSDASELPNFKYEAGGLEDPRIRTLVCQYLEGGEEAFRRRAERYGDIVKRAR
jgi:predicted ATP-dependent endonuclease of OLD family